MVRLVKTEGKKKKKPGRPTKLIIEDQVLMMIQYWREYRSYYHIGLDWGLSESAVCRTVYQIENILIRSKKLSLPGKKELGKMSNPENLVVMDVTESPIEKPQRGQKRFFSGKQKDHFIENVAASLDKQAYLWEDICNTCEWECDLDKGSICVQQDLDFHIQLL